MKKTRILVIARILVFFIFVLIKTYNLKPIILIICNRYDRPNYKGLKSEAGCLQMGQTKSAGSSSPS